MGQNLLGLVLQVWVYVVLVGLVIDGLMVIDMLWIVVLQVVLVEFLVIGYVLNLIDWVLIELQKDGMGCYIIGQLQGSVFVSLWWLFVVEILVMGVGKFLIGVFQMGVEVFDFWDLCVEVGFENDDFICNLLILLVEEWIVFVVYCLEVFIYGDIVLVVFGG